MHTHGFLEVAQALYVKQAEPDPGLLEPHYGEQLNNNRNSDHTLTDGANRSKGMWTRPNLSS